VGDINPKDLNMKNTGRTFHSTCAYSASKLAQVCGAESACVSRVCRIEFLNSHYVKVD
jgi:hypothetical protein